LKLNGSSDSQNQIDDLDKLQNENLNMTETISIPEQEANMLNAAPSPQLENQHENSILFFLRQRVIIVNLIVMTYMWAACSFTYYMILIYVKYLPGNIYVNTLASGSSEMVAYALAGVVYSKVGLKWTFTSFFAFSFVGGILILFLGNSQEALMPIFVTVAKFGISGLFTVLYVCTNDVFPVMFCSSALGICNLSSRMLTIFSSLVAEVPPPLPMILFSSLCLAGIFLIQFVKTNAD